MAIRIQIVRSAFQASLVLAAVLLAAIATTLYLQPVAALTAAQQPQNPTVERAPLREPFDMDDARAASESDVASAYEQALRQACALPASEWNWQGLGPAAAALPKSICQADAATQTRWRAALLARMKSGKNGAPQFSSGAVAAHEKSSVWWASAGANGLWRGTPDGWRAASNGATAFVAVSPADPQVIYALRAGNQLDQSTNGGETFIAASDPFPEKNVLNTAPLALHATDAAQVWTGGRALWRSTNGGERWERMTDNVQGTAANRVSAIALPWASSSYVLAGTSEGWIQHFNLGAEAAANNLAVLPRRGYVSSLTFDPHDARIAYATFSTFEGAHVWQSADQGMTWQPLDGAGPAALPDIPVNALAVDPQAAGRLFVGTDLGVFVTEDNGQHWSLALPGVWVTALQLASNGQLYAFGNSEVGAGLWAVKLGESGFDKNLGTGGCVAGVSPGALVLNAAGETKVLSILTSTQCDWVVSVETATASWLSINGAPNGRGNGSVQLRATANTQPEQRFGSVTVDGRVVSVFQAGTVNNCAATPIVPGVPITGEVWLNDCVVSTSPDVFYLADYLSFQAKEGDLLSTSVTWLPTTGDAGGSYGYQITNENGLPVTGLPNSGQYFGVPRDGTYFLQFFIYGPLQPLKYRAQIQIQPPGCISVSLNALDRMFGPTASSGRLMVSAGSNCSWQAVSTVPWLTFPANSGQGSQLVEFRVAENTTASARVGFLQVGDQRVDIYQAANGADCEVRRLTAGNQQISAMLNPGDCLQRLGDSFPADAYVFDGLAGQRVSAELVFPASALCCGWINVILQTERGELLAQGESTAISRSLQGYILPADGRYKLFVTGSSAQSGVPYDLYFSLAPANCTYQVNPERLVVGSAASSVRVNVQTQSQCPWQVAREYGTEWLSLPAGVQGIGPGGFNLPVPANPRSERRRYQGSVQGQRFHLLQVKDSNCSPKPLTPGQPVTGTMDSAGCLPLYSEARPAYPFSQLAAQRYTFEAAQGQVFSFVLGPPTGASPYWPNVLNSVGYALVDPNGTVVMAGQTDPNLPPPSMALVKTGTYTFEISSTPLAIQFGYSLLINLNTQSCATAASVNNSRFEAAGGQGVIQINAPAGCPWKVELQSGALVPVFDDPVEGTGNAQIRFGVRVNSTQFARQAVLRIGEQTLALEQAGASGSCREVALPFDQFVDGSLTLSDCAVSKPLDGYYDSRVYGDVYTFQGTAGEQVALNAPRRFIIGQFRLVAPVLRLYDPDGVLLTDALVARNLAGHYLLPKTGVYRVTVSQPDSTQGMVGEYQILLERLTAGCVYDVPSELQRFDWRGGNGTYQMRTSSVCQWKARTNADWIHPTSPATNGQSAGTSAGTFTVDTNSQITTRVGSLIVGGRLIEIEQAGIEGECSIKTLTPNMTASGVLAPSDCRARTNQALADFYRLEVKTNDRIRIRSNTTSTGYTQFQIALLDETWRVAASWVNNDSTWLSLPQGVYYLQVQASSTVANTRYTISYEVISGVCGYALNPAIRFFPRNGGSVTANIQAGTGCAWTATNGFYNNTGNIWFSLTGNRSGTGSGAVTYEVQPLELIGGTRSGWIEVGDQRVNVAQTNAPETCVIKAATLGQTINGLLDNSDCPALFLQSTQMTRADQYELTIQEGKQFAFEVAASEALSLTLYDADKRIVAQSINGISRLPYAEPGLPRFLFSTSNQTYRLEVASLSNPFSAVSYTLNITTPTKCTYNFKQLTPAGNQPSAANGDSGTFQVITASDCPWTVQTLNSAPEVFSFTTPTTGTGVGTVGYSFTRNPGASYRAMVIAASTPESGRLPLILGQLGQGGTCVKRVITPGQVVTGTMREGDCRVSLAPPGLNAFSSMFQWMNDNPTTHQFTFNGTVGDIVNLTQRTRTEWNGGNVRPGYFGLYDPQGQLMQRGVFLPYVNQPRLVLPVDGTYTLEFSNGLGDYEFVLDVLASKCGYYLSSEDGQVSSTGGTGTVKVTTLGECRWTAYSTEPWITVNNGSGQGNGNVSFTVAPNNAAQASTRRGFIRLGERLISIVQAGSGSSCAPIPINAGQTVAGEITQTDCLRLGANQYGSTQQVDRYVFTARTGELVSVKAVSNASLGVQIIPLSSLWATSTNYEPRQPVDWFGTAALTIPADGSYVIEVMPSASVQQTIPYTVHLAVNAPGCGINLSETTRLFASATGAGSFSVTAPVGCQWQVYAANDWITITGARERTGAATVGYTLAANTGDKARWGSILVGGQIYVIEQAGVGSAAGGLGTCVTGELNAGQTVFGTLSLADCQPFIQTNSIGVADRYRFTGKAGQGVQIIGRFADDSLPKLSLFDAQGGLLAQSADFVQVSPVHARIPQSGLFFNLPQDGAYFIEVNARVFLPVDKAIDYSLSLTNAPAACAYTVSASQLRFDGAGGTASIEVVTAAGCSWSVVSSENWVNSSSVAQAGSGRATVTVAPNPSNKARRSLLLVGGRICVIEQAGANGSCQARPLISGQRFTNTIDQQDCPGGTLPQEDRPQSGLTAYAKRYSFTGKANDRLSFAVTRAPNSNSAVAIRLMGPNGAQLVASSTERLPVSGERYALPANGTYEIEVAADAGTTYEVNFLLGSSACRLDLEQKLFAFETAGGAGRLRFTADSACAWRAYTDANWVSLGDGTSQPGGTGNGELAFTVAANSELQARIAYLALDDEVVKIEQAGVGGSCAARTIASNQIVSGAWDRRDCQAQSSRLVSPDYVERFIFSGTANQRVMFAVESDLTPLMEFYDPQGQLMVGLLGKRLPASVGEIVLPVTGNYTLLLKAAGIARYRLLSSTPLGCNYTITPAPLTVAGSGGKHLVTVTPSQSACTWTARSTSQWLTLDGVTPAAYGETPLRFYTGTRTLEVVAAPNLGLSRTGQLWIADQVFSIRQETRQLKEATRPLMCFNAASLKSGSFAPESLVAAFGQHLAMETKSTPPYLLPELGYTTVTVTDRTQSKREAYIQFASPTQVNFVMPLGTAAGLAEVAITSGDGVVTRGTIQVETLAPGIFTLNGSGTGFPAGRFYRLRNQFGVGDEPIARFDQVKQEFVAVPVKVDTPGEAVQLYLQATGLRYVRDPSLITALVGDTLLPVAAVSVGFGVNFGVDQLVLNLPPALAGRGLVTLRVNVDGKLANEVQFAVK